MAIICLLILTTFALVTNLHGLPIAKDLPGRKRSPEEIGGHFEGDIIIPSIPRGVAMIGDYVRWPKGIVPYTILSDFSIADRNLIINAMRTLESLTAVNNVLCVQFREKVDSDGPYYITIQNGVGCSSIIGRYTDYTVDRTMILETPSCLYTGIVMHELIHTLGFYHEQSRPDRDDYVKVIWDNIIPGCTNVVLAIKKRATTKYIVVISTEDESVTGSLSLVMSGPGVITVKTPDTTAISVHNGIWYEPHYFTLAFYPQANYTVYGKGRDSLGLYVAKGVYSPRTLRMAFDKYYQTEFGNVRQNQNKKMTIQVTWNPFTQSFEGKHYLKDGKYVEEQPYIMQITNVPYFR
ncbi:unnamed protein product [Rotaria sp. Silwood1]|nr:unnamed protein product [Rotaria sp. Silwood1]